MRQDRAARGGRIYPEGMRRMQAFYARYPQFRDVEFAVCDPEVVIFCQRDCDELREACELYGLCIRCDAPVAAGLAPARGRRKRPSRASSRRGRLALDGLENVIEGARHGSRATIGG